MSMVSDLFGGNNRSPNTQITVPGKSPEEIALLSEQTALLKQQESALSSQLKEQDLLKPYLFSQLGIQEKRDEAGNLVGYEQTPGAAKTQADNKEIQDLLNTRTKNALTGNLPVDPQMERELSQGRLDLQESLRKQLGTGYATSTPGIQALQTFDQRAEELRYNARNGLLNSSEQMAGARDLRTSQIQTQNFGNVVGANTSSLPFIQAGTNVAAGFNGPLSNLFNDRQLSVNAQAAEVGNRVKLFDEQSQNYRFATKSALNIFGTIFGMGAGGGGGPG